jgi:hypothetical protein
MRFIRLAAALVLTAGTLAIADEQQIAPGTGEQDSVVIDTGADGICNTTAASGDIQFAAVGSGSPNRTEVRCGPNKTVDTIAQGDDVQLIAFGAPCNGANTAIIDTGADGIPNTSLAGDDTYASGIALGIPPANRPCVITGEDGVAQTTAAAGDDTQLLLPGAAAANTAVVLCGPNLVADTHANNFATGDDVQVIPVGNACATANDVVVDSGADGIAATRAEGPDLRISTVRPVKMTISSGHPNASKLVKFKVTNVEFGPTAPIARAYKITTTSGSCGGGVVTQVDADGVTPGLQATGIVPINSSTRVSLVATMKLQNVTTVASNNPFRCTFNVSVVALDTDPAVDDGANDEGNTTTVDLEVNDRNDH